MARDSPKENRHLRASLTTDTGSENGQKPEREKASHNSFNMTPRLNLDKHQSDSCWSSDDKLCQPHETSAVPIVKKCQRSKMKMRWEYLLGQLSRTTLRGNVQPAIGQQCIIMKGIAGQDEGQMGVITSRSRVMVDVTFAHPTGKGTQTRKKQPCSLVLLEPGLCLVQDSNGSVWVRTVKGTCQQAEKDVMASVATCL
jgi:hypothetical protein